MTDGDVGCKRIGPSWKKAIRHLGLISTIAMVLAVLLVVPSSAGAHHIPGATYTGQVEGGGTVTFYTAPDLDLCNALIHPDVACGDPAFTVNDVCKTPDDRCALQFKDVPTCAGSLIASANYSYIYNGDEWYGVHGFESRPYGEGDFDYHGLFASPNGAYGTLTYRFCGSHTVSWEATTDSTNPPWVDPCPNPQCDFGLVDPPNDGSGDDDGASADCKKAKKRVERAKEKLKQADTPSEVDRAKKKLKKAKAKKKEACGG